MGSDAPAFGERSARSVVSLYTPCVRAVLDGGSEGKRLGADDLPYRTIRTRRACRRPPPTVAQA